MHMSQTNWLSMQQLHIQDQDGSIFAETNLDLPNAG